MHFAAVEEGRGAAEDEIHVPCHVAIREVVPSAIQQQRVLPAQQPAAAKFAAIAIHPQRHGLPDRTRGVRDRDIFPLHAIAIDLHGRRAKRAQRPAIGSRLLRMQIERDHRLRGILSMHPDMPALALHIHPLAVGAGLHEDVPPRRGGIGAHRRGADRLLDRAKIARTVRRHNGVRRRRARECAAREQHGESFHRLASGSRNQRAAQRG